MGKKHLIKIEQNINTSFKIDIALKHIKTIKKLCGTSREPILGTMGQLPANKLPGWLLASVL
jgi:hypothetical protein